MGFVFRKLGKIFCLALFAGLGIAAGVIVFSSFMLAEVEGSSMMPGLEPGDKVLVLRNSPLYGQPEVETGNLVVYEAPCYTTDGEGIECIRRVTGIRGSWIRLDCDMKTVKDQEILTDSSHILGKAIFNLSTMTPL